MIWTIAVEFPRPGKWPMMMIFLLLISTCCLAQKAPVKRLSIRGNFSYPQLFDTIEKKTGYTVRYSPEIFWDTSRIYLYFRNEPLDRILKACLEGTQLEAEIRPVENTADTQIVILRKHNRDTDLYYPIEGSVMSSDSQPLAGATISVKSNHKQQTFLTDASGNFRIRGKAREVIATISYVGYYPRVLKLDNTEFHNIQLEPSSVNMDAAIVQLYGMTTERLTTGSSSRVKGADLEHQAVSNVLQALEGRVPGLVIQQGNGVPGSYARVLIRGLNSIAQGRDPLILLDGVPIAGYNSYLSTIGSASAQGILGASVLNSIALSSIANIEVLKDASATSIYGSRGSNGVILITLKPGLSGKLKCTVDGYSGYASAPGQTLLLNTEQYLDLRREAILNDGLPVNPITLPELYDWNSSRNTDYRKFTTGNKGSLRDFRVTLSGGDSSTSFLVAGNYHGESAAFTGHTGDDRLSIFGNLSHQSGDRRWQFHLSELYSLENVSLPRADPSSFMLTAPNAPAPYDAAGNFVWQQNGLHFINIPAQALNSYRAMIRNNFIHLQGSYNPFKGFFIKGSLGDNIVVSEEWNRQPPEAQDPATNPTGHTARIQNKYNSTIFELTPEYTFKIGSSKLETLLGLTWQQESKSLFSVLNDGYTSNVAMNDGSPAPQTSNAENKIAYRYEALFGRINYNLVDRYILTLSGRRDGSSRFGPGRQFGNFWALGTAWIFSDEAFFRHHLSWLSIGKLRGSYGITGNDQIGDNQFAQTYRSTAAARGYQGQQGVVPTSFFNSKLGWEINRKTELATDLGFLGNRLVFSAAAYRNWTDNQLIYQSLPYQSGLPGVITNEKAAVLNTGLEFTLQVNLGDSNSLRWSSTFSLTTQQNKLLRFPALADHTYEGGLVEGQSLNVVNGYQFTGVNRMTGLNTFKDVNGDSVLDKQDWVVGGNFDLTAYAGWQNTFRYKRWQLDLSVEARKQHAPNPLLVYYSQNAPGMAAPSMLGNVPVGFLHHWRQPGDRSDLQKLTATPGTAAANTLPYYLASNAWVSDASFIRLKSLSVSYSFPENWLSKLHATEARIYLRGQNLWTGTSYRYADPETQDPTVLPPTRNWVAGIQITFK